MTTCTKYVVKEMNKAIFSEDLQDWFNEIFEKENLELVAIDGNNYIFKRNAYIKSIRQVDNSENLPL
jgi:hypothetical protein